MLSLVGLGLGSAEDVTLRGKKVIEQADFVYLDAYTAILPAAASNTSSRDEATRRKVNEDVGGQEHALETEQHQQATETTPEQEHVLDDILELQNGETSAQQLFHLYPEKQILLADRELVESGKEILDKVEQGKKVAFLVVGDALCATTHTDLILRCKEKKLRYEVVHNASIMNAISSCGLQLYRFGETVSLPFWQNSWRPESFYDKIIANRRMNLHTLCLLDIQVKERSMLNMKRGIFNVFEPPRYMTVGQALEQLVEIARNRKTCEKDDKSKSSPAGLEAKSVDTTPSSSGEISEQRAAREEHELFDSEQEFDLESEKNLIGVARIGAVDQVIKVGDAAKLMDFDFGPPLHALVIPAYELHECELEFLEYFR
ncbi:unnamed protein product [Amoebophrya sp. A120]|nr:unnamed protein product [Amoebophrya sp. A120]|eukprot:GSA120T00014483001.1